LQEYLESKFAWSLASASDQEAKTDTDPDTAAVTKTQGGGQGQGGGRITSTEELWGAPIWDHDDPTGGLRNNSRTAA
jgi:hypothetical protein